MVNEEIWTGGCQCGAVRYRLLARPRNALICHCRMCQKHTGSAFGAFAEVASDEFLLTRGSPAFFRSSDDGERSFCRDCGTPLGYRYSGRPLMAIAIGSLDRHAEIRPLLQYGIESREPWFEDIGAMPAMASGDGEDPERFNAIRASNHQHPDHDTAEWPSRPSC